MSTVVYSTAVRRPISVAIGFYHRDSNTRYRVSVSGGSILWITMDSDHIENVVKTPRKRD